MYLFFKRRSIAMGGLFCLLFLFVFLASALAQDLPDAGSLQREGERSLQAPYRGPRSLSPPPRPMLREDKTLDIKLKSIVISGATLIEVSELEALFDDLTGQSISLLKLEHASQRIAELYRKRGWFARVYLPEQDITEGNVIIQVLESYYGGSRLQKRGLRADAGFVQKLVTNKLEEDQPLSACALERGLLLANDLYGIKTTGLLEPGDKYSTSRLLVQVEDTALVSGDIGINNHGIKSTGEFRGIAGLGFNNLTGLGDQFSIRAMTGSSSSSGVLRHSLPLFHNGLRLISHAYFLDYYLRDKYKSLDAEGKAYTAGLSLSYPLLRSLSCNFYISPAYEYRQYDDDMLGLSLHRHRINSFSLNLSGDSRDSFLRGAVNWGGVELIYGHLHISDVNEDRAQDRLYAKTHGSYTKVSFYFNRLQSLCFDGLQLLFGVAGQLSDGNLSSSERFSLGGPHMVRAYPVNEANGDEGIFLKLELQQRFARDFKLIAFYDLGYIHLHKKTWEDWDAGRSGFNNYSLSAVGLGLNWYGSNKLEGLSASLSAAIPVDNNRGENQRGENSDGSNAKSLRAWGTLNWSF